MNLYDRKQERKFMKEMHVVSGFIPGWTPSTNLSGLPDLLKEAAGSMGGRGTS
jgi:hypothetical protein